MNLKALVVALSATWASAYGQSGEMVVKNGFYSGNAYIAAPEIVRLAYLSGMVDGILYAPALGAPKTRLLAFEQCFMNMTSNQILAITDQYIAKHPESWDWDMHIHFFNAMHEACKTKGLDISKPR